MKRTAFAFPILIALLLSACASAPTAASAASAAPAEPAAPMLQAERAGAPVAPGATSASDFSGDLKSTDGAQQNASPSDQPNDGKRVLLLDATYTLLVKDAQVAANKIIDIASAKNGWVVSSNISQGGYYGPQGEKYFSGTIAIRIPADQLNETRKEIEALAVEVTNRQLTGRDVTQAYTDLQARLENKEASAAQLRSMIADLRGAGYDTDKPEVVTAKVQALAQLADQLDRVQGEIDSMKGQLNYYNESAAYSIVTINLQPYIPSQPIEVAGWHPDGVAKQALQDLIYALQGLVDILIKVGICGIPALLIIALFLSPFVWAGRTLYRRAKRKPGQ
jgi:hypothetical protein